MSLNQISAENPGLGPNGLFDGSVRECWVGGSRVGSGLVPMQSWAEMQKSAGGPYNVNLPAGLDDYTSVSSGGVLNTNNPPLFTELADGIQINAAGTYQIILSTLYRTTGVGVVTHLSTGLISGAQPRARSSRNAQTQVPPRAQSVSVTEHLLGGAKVACYMSSDQAAGAAIEFFKISIRMVSLA